MSKVRVLPRYKEGVEASIIWLQEIQWTDGRDLFRLVRGSAYLENPKAQIGG